MDQMSDKKVIKSLELQLKQAIQQGNTYKNKIQDKNQRIQKLQNDVMKRDKILELCLNNQNEVYVTPSAANEDRIFEIRNKQQIPFWIKTEQLSPLIHEHSEDGYVIGDNFMESFHHSEYVDASFKTKSQSASEYFLESPSSSSSYPSKRSYSPSPTSPAKNEQKPNNDLNSFSQKKFKFEIKEEKTSTNSFLSSSEFSNSSSKTRESIESPPKLKFPLPVQSSENVLDIPEILRYNFGTSDSDLGECPIGKKFWFDLENSYCTKFFLKLHDKTDSGNWRSDRKFVLIEQIGLEYPKNHYLNFNEILEKINAQKLNKKIRIWLDVRDVDVFSPSGQNILESVEKSISHFSIGTKAKYVHANEELRSHLLLDFIFGHLPSLEYLSVNNGMIYPFDSHLTGSRHNQILQKLKTVRLIFSKPHFSMPLIKTILKMSPNLQCLYGLPLICLRELINTNILKDQVKICSIYIQRSFYRGSESKALDFLKDLEFLTSIKNWNSLDHFEAQLFFLQCKFSTLSQCIKAMSKIILRHENSVTKLKLEPFHDSNKELRLSRMNNLTTLQFDVNLRNGFENLRESFFPKGFDINENFPALNSVEILLEFSNFHNSSKENALDLFEKLFPGDIFKPNLNRVKSLKLHEFYNVSCMPRLAQLFPNLQLLQLHCDLIHVATLLPHFYKLWPGLEQLQIESFVDTRFGNLDCALSGMDKRTCDRMQWQNSSTLNLEVDQEQFEKYYTKYAAQASSIRTMKNLKILRFVLCPSSKFSHLPIFTRIGASALSKLSGLSGVGKEDTKFKVDFSFDGRTTTKEREEIISAHSSLLSFPFVTFNR